MPRRLRETTGFGDEDTIYKYSIDPLFLFSRVFSKGILDRNGKI